MKAVINGRTIIHGGIFDWFLCTISHSRSSMKQSLRKKAPSPPKGASALREVKEEGEEQHQQNKPKYSSDESSDEEDTRDLEGNVYTKAGMEVRYFTKFFTETMKKEKKKEKPL